jgi:sec-independent protein translocase protein TatA
MELANPLHLALLLVVLLLVFGAKRLPEMGRGLGDGMRSFKDAVSGTPAPAPALVAAEAHHDAPAASVSSATTAVAAE